MASRQAKTKALSSGQARRNSAAGDACSIDAVPHYDD